MVNLLNDLRPFLARLFEGVRNRASDYSDILQNLAKSMEYKAKDISLLDTQSNMVIRRMLLVTHTHSPIELCYVTIQANWFHKHSHELHRHAFAMPVNYANYLLEQIFRYKRPNENKAQNNLWTLKFAVLDTKFTFTFTFTFATAMANSSQTHFHT